MACWVSAMTRFMVKTGIPWPSPFASYVEPGMPCQACPKGRFQDPSWTCYVERVVDVNDVAKAPHNGQISPAARGVVDMSTTGIPCYHTASPSMLDLIAQGDSDGARPPSDRQLKRALIVPMHGTQRVRPSGASVDRRQASTSSAPP